MKLVPILEASYAGNAKGGLSDKEMIKKYFVNDSQLASDIGELTAQGRSMRVIKAFIPKQGLTALYQYGYPHPVKFILLLGDGSWSIEMEEEVGEAHVLDLDGIQLYSMVYAQ